MRSVRWPEWNLAHLRRLTDSTGIAEHAVGAVPNAAEGYTLDDNARALVVVLRYYHQTRDPEAMELAIRYLGFVLYCQMEDGWFHNDVGYDRRFLDERGPEDPVGRAIWALGEAVSLAEVDGVWTAALRTLDRTLPWAERFLGLRPMAFALLGLRALLKAPPERLGRERASAARRLTAALGERLVQAYHRARAPGWAWFEERLTYSNARLPQALVAAWEVTGRRAFLQSATDTLEFLWNHQWSGRYVQIVGNRGWSERGGQRALFDQQPVDAGALAEAASSFYEATGRDVYLERAMLALEWFYGRNVHGVVMHDEATGGCRDGLGADGPNLNEGAESTLAHLLARMAVEEGLRLSQSGGVNRSSALA
ncbi:MAG: glycosyltransferase [Limnochordaceae bacterium]|nr:glycosyltransferase [Limnochordaceae bacterium]